MVYYFAGAAITKHHKLGGLDNRNLQPQFWSLEIQDEDVLCSPSEGP